MIIKAIGWGSLAFLLALFSLIAGLGGLANDEAWIFHAAALFIVALSVFTAIRHDFFSTIKKR